MGDSSMFWLVVLGICVVDVVVLAAFGMFK